MGDTRKRLEWMFSVYDLDKNGSIQYQEFKALVEVANNPFYYITVECLKLDQYINGQIPVLFPICHDHVTSRHF